MRALAFLVLFAVSCAHARRPYEGIVEAAVATPLAEGRYAGAVLVMHDGRTLVRKAYGFDNRPDSRFMVMSVSKQFTAALIMRLVAKGKLSLDDRAGKYLDRWPAEWDAVTIHSLLSHSAGLDIDTTYFWLVEHHPEYWAEPGVTPPAYEPKPLLFAPGTTYRYANVGYTLLTMIAERTGGKPFDVLMREEVFEPLQLTQTEPERHGKPRPRRVRGHAPATLEISEQQTIDIIGAGDVVSTVDDLAKFDRAFEHDRFLPAGLRAKMRTPHVRTSAGAGIGYGWFIHDGGIYGHNGSGAGFRAFNYTIPSKKLIVVVLSNVADVDATWVRSMVDRLATSVR